MNGHRPGRAVIALGAAAAMAAASGCGTSRPGVGSADLPAAAPLATAVETSGGTWATVAMGQLSDPANTFWQLLYRPAGAARWVDDVSATATATNGGLNLAATPAGVLVGVQPSQSLTFSPLVETADGGRNWTTGVLPGALSPSPAALAVSSAGGHSALLGAPGTGQEVVTAGSGITRWTVAATEAAVTAAGPSCGVTGLDAVGYHGSTALIGASCSQPGRAGIFELGPAGPTPLDVRLAADRAGATEVLAFSDSPAGVGALIASGAAHGTSLTAAWSDPSLGAWTVSASLAVPSSEGITSVESPSGRFLVLLPGALYSTGPGQRGWTPLPVPPAGTSAVAPLAGGGLSAIVVHGSSFTDWGLAAGASSWTAGPTTNVPILYGTSS